MKNLTKFALIGYGNMGSIFYEKLAENTSLEFTVVDAYVEKLKSLAVKTSTSFMDIPVDTEVIILAIKPQQLHDLAQNKELFKNKIIITMLAGTEIDTIRDMLGVEKVYRVMPNLGAKQGLGVILKTTKGLDSAEEAYLDEQLSRLGEIEACAEADINRLTVIFGSGPAYFFHLSNVLLEECNSFTDAKSARSQKLVKQLFLSAAMYASESELNFAEMEDQVKSKGGITEVVIDSLNSAGYTEMFTRALGAGVQKADELTQLNKLQK